jgi:hypothetical protein
MILDRIFGLIATTAFALGVAVHIELLSRAREASPLDPPILTFFVLTLIAIAYAYYRAELKYGVRTPHYEVDFYTMAFSLPGWPRAVSVILFSYIVLLILGIGDLRTLLPAELSVLQESLRVNGILAIVTAALALQSFVIAAYFLIREPIKEFR